MDLKNSKKEAEIFVFHGTKMVRNYLTSNVTVNL